MEAVWGALPQASGSFGPGDPPGVRGSRGRRPVPGRRRPAPRRARRRARAARALEHARTWSCSRSSSARSSPSRTRSCRRPPGASGRGTSRTGRAARSRCAAVRAPAGVEPARLGDLRGSRPGRWAGRSGSARSRTLRAEAARLLEPRTVEPAHDGVDRDGTAPAARRAHAAQLPAAGRRGAAVRGRGRAEGRRSATRRSSRSTPRTPRSAASSDGDRALVRTDAGEADAPGPRHRAHRQGRGVRARSTSRAWRRTACSPARSRPRAVTEAVAGEAADGAGRRGRRGRGGGLMDWLDWVLLVAKVVVVFFALLIAVMLLIWMERKVIADMQTRVGPMRAGPRGHPHHARRRDQALLQGGDHADARRPAGLPDRAGDRDAPRVPRVRGDPVRHRAWSCSDGR